jgi:site-specific recombinase XerD
MKTLREQFIEQNQLKGRSPRTIDTYVDALIALTRHYKTSPDLLTTEQIREYLVYCMVEKKLSKSWLNQTISALKILHVDVLKREWNKLDIPRVRGVIKLPVVFSTQEVAVLLMALKNPKHRALLQLAYSAGLRVSEVRHLKVTDIDSARMQVRIEQSKGNKDRYVVLSPVVLPVLREYYKQYRPKVYLFENKDGLPVPERTAQKIFKRAVVKSGIKKTNVSFHTLRHSFATHLMEQGTAMPIIQQMMGHKSLRSTSIYLHVQQYSLDKVRSPLDNLNLNSPTDGSK